MVVTEAQGDAGVRHYTTILLPEEVRRQGWAPDCQAEIEVLGDCRFCILQKEAQESGQ